MPSRAERYLDSILTALRLASLYAACVALLLIAALLSEWSEFELFSLRYLAVPAVYCFAVAAVCLSVGRRVGMTVMLVGMFGLWLWSWASNLQRNALGQAFVSWTVFAAPLYLICSREFNPSSSQRSPWFPVALTAIWAGLAAAAIAARLGRSLPVDAIRLMIEIAWMFTPPMLSVLMFYRIHRRDSEVAPAT